LRRQDNRSAAPLQSSRPVVVTAAQAVTTARRGSTPGETPAGLSGAFGQNVSETNRWRAKSAIASTVAAKQN